MELFTTYILHSGCKKHIYIGFTSNLIQRIISHNKLGHGWTAKHRPWKVIYCEYFEEKALAMTREKALKQYRWLL